MGPRCSDTDWMRVRGIIEKRRLKKPSRIANTASVRPKARRLCTRGSRIFALGGIGVIQRSSPVPARRDSRKPSGSSTPRSGIAIAIAWMTSVRLPTGSSTSEATSTCMPLFFSSDVCAALPACVISTPIAALNPNSRSKRAQTPARRLNAPARMPRKLMIDVTPTTPTRKPLRPRRKTPKNRAIALSMVASMDTRSLTKPTLKTGRSGASSGVFAVATRAEAPVRSTGSTTSSIAPEASARRRARSSSRRRELSRPSLMLESPPPATSMSR